MDLFSSAGSCTLATLSSPLMVNRNKPSLMFTSVHITSSLLITSVHIMQAGQQGSHQSSTASGEMQGLEKQARDHAPRGRTETLKAT